MQLSSSRYDSADYWERMLTLGDVWQRCLAKHSHQRPVILNTAIMDRHAPIFDNNWGCYPDAYSALGFMQHIFLPTAFYLKMHPEHDLLYIPIEPAEDFLRDVEHSAAPEREIMADCLRELDALWVLNEGELDMSLRAFCKRFNAQWQGDDAFFHVTPYFHTREVGRAIRKEIWAEEMLKQELDLTGKELNAFCQQFYRQPQARELFMRFLNHRVGCLA